MAAKQAITKAFEPVWNWASRRYQAAVAKELKKYGLPLPEP
jgi:ubiquinol-cytochrome c reductase subunit 7